MMKSKRGSSSKRSSLETLMDRVGSELFLRDKQNQQPESDAPDALRRPARARRQDFTLEAVEPRLLLSADLSYAALDRPATFDQVEGGSQPSLVSTFALNSATADIDRWLGPDRIIVATHKARDAVLDEPVTSAGAQGSSSSAGSGSAAAADAFSDETADEQITDLGVLTELLMPGAETAHPDDETLFGPEQVFFLDLDGALDVDYRGPVSVDDIDVQEFVAPGDLAGKESDVVQAMTTALNSVFFDIKVIFTTERPDSGEYSTIYIGDAGAAFAQWGPYYGLAESVDVGNRNRSDVAFVFSSEIASAGLTAAQYGEQLALVVAHEAGHLLGIEHQDHGHSDDENENPLADVAFDPKVHVALANDAAEDAVADGKVTISLNVNGTEVSHDYVVHPRIVEALEHYRSYYNAGSVAGDGFPDVAMGQYAIHPIDHGTWLTRILDMAWQAQGDPSYSEAEKLQILAWSYGFLSHSAGDHFAHTLVNQFAEGVAPGVGAAGESITTDQRDLGNMLRHFMTEAYIADALPGVDGNKSRTLISDNGTPGDPSDDDYSDISSPGIDYDAPIRFIYETLLRAFPDDPTAIVEMKWDTGTLKAANTGPTSGTFTRSDGDFGQNGDGFKVGHKITVSGFEDAANNGTFLITNISADGKVLTVNAPLSTQDASGDETIVVHVARTAPIDITADAATNAFTRSDGGSFKADGFVAGMRFDALGMTENARTYIVQSVDDDKITVVGGISTGPGTFSELKNETAVNVQLVAVGDRGPALGKVFALRDWVFEKAVAKGARGTPNELGDVAGQVINALIEGDPIDAFEDDLFRAYLYNWVDEIDEGVRHWGELGLAFTRAVFDPGSRRDLQQEVGEDTGFPDTADPDTIRSKAEDGVGLLDVLIAELDDLDGDGSTSDSFINKHLLPMAGLPAELGLLRSALQAFSSELGTILQPFEDLFNPIEAAINDVKNYVKDFIKDQFKEKFGVDFEVLEALKNLGNKMDLASITIGDKVIPIFKPGDHELLDSYLGLPADHHTGTLPTTVKPFPKVEFTFYSGAQDLLTNGATLNKDTFAAYRNAVTLTKLQLLMESPTGDEIAGAGAAKGQLSQLYSDILTDINGTPTTYNFAHLNLHGAHGGNILTATLPGAPGSADGQIWMTSIDADQVWRADNYTINNTLFRVSQSNDALSPVTYEATGLPDGEYKVYASWQANVTQKLDNLVDEDLPDQHISPTQFAQYTVYDGTIARGTFQEDQRLFSNDLVHDGLSFEQLGADESTTFTVSSGTLKVTLSNLTGEARHVIAGPILFERMSDGAKFRIQNTRDPQTLAPVTIPGFSYTDDPTYWTDVVYDLDDHGGGGGNNPLWESATLRPVFRELFTDWINQPYRTVLFNTAESTLDDEDKAALDAVVATMAANSQLTATVAGHTDTLGTAEANQTLSDARATAVFNYLTSNGIASSRLTKVAFGENNLKVRTADGVAEPLNRRVEITLHPHFPDLGDAPTTDPNDGTVAKVEFASHATPFGPEIEDQTVEIAIPDVLKTAILDGIEGLVNLADTIEAAAPLQIKIPVVNKSLAELVNLKATIEENIQDPIVGYFNNGAPNHYFSELFDIISPSLGTWSPGEGSSFEFELDLRAAFANNDLALQIGDADGDFGLEVDGTVDVGALLGFVDDATKALPRFAFGVDVSSSPTFYIRAESLVLHAEAHAKDLDFGARLGFLSVGVQDGSVDFDADAEIDLSVLDANDDKKITLSEISANLADLEVTTRGTLDGALPMTVAPGILPDVDVGTVTFAATDIFDLSTYAFDYDGLDAPALNFGNIDAAGVVSLVARLADELDNLRDKGFFDQIDIPLVAGAVDAVLDFADVIASGLLYDPGADGVKDGADRLATDLNAALAAAGLDSALVVQGDGTRLTFQIIDPTVNSFKIERAAGDSADFGASGLGFVASDADDFKAAHQATPGDGIVAGDVTLKVTLKRGTAEEVVLVAVTAASTANNAAVPDGHSGIGDDTIKLVRADNSATFDTVQELTHRLNTILGLGSAVAYNAATEALTINLGALLPQLEFDEDLPIDFDLDLGPLLGIESDTQVNVQAKLGFDDGFTLGIYLGDTVPGAQSNLSPTTLLQELNGGDGVDIKTAPSYTAPLPAITIVRPAGPLVGGGLETFALANGDAHFALQVGGVSHQVTVKQADTAANATIDDLVADVNAALLAALPATLDGKIVAAKSSNALMLRVTDASIGEVGFSAAADDPAVLELGLPSNARLTGDATFKIKLRDDPTEHSIVVPQDRNQTVGDIVAEINSAIGALPLAGKIQAEADGNRIVLRALLPEIYGFSLTAAATDPAVKNLGFFTAQTSTGPLVGDGLETFALVNGDAHFALQVGGATHQVTVKQADTAANATIDHLVADVNAALLAALPATLDGKIVAAKSSNALVLRTTDASIGDVGFSARTDDPAVLELGLPHKATIARDARLEAGEDVALLVGRLSQNATITINTNSGLSGTVTLLAADTASNTTVLSLVKDLNKALSASSFADKLVAKSVGNRLVLSALDPAITSFTVAGDAGAAALGLGAGPAASNSFDFEIQVSDGAVYGVALDGATTIEHVITAIETATSNAVSVLINEAGTGLILIDNTFSTGGTNTHVFMVSPVNDSGAAVGLGIAGVDSTDAAERDGRIDGGQLMGVRLTDRFFISNAALEASLVVTTPGGINATANVGFVGIKLTGDASVDADFTIGLKDPSSSGSGNDGNITLTEFIGGLSNFGSLLDAPSLTGLAQFDLAVELDGALPFIVGDGSVRLQTNLGDLLDRWDDTVDVGAATITRLDDTHFTLSGDFTDEFLRGARVEVGAAFQGFVAEVSYDDGADATTVTVVTLDNGGVLPTSLAGLSIGTPNTPEVDLDTQLGDLVSFTNINFNFASIVDALLLVRDLISEIDTVDSLLNRPIPLVDVSVNDLLEFADTFSDALTRAQQNPAASLQLLDRTISEAFGVDPAGDLIKFSLDNFGTAANFQDDVLRLELNLGAAFSESLNVRIPDLDLGLDFLAEAVDFGGAATVGASGAATFDLDIGIGLNDPSKVYLYNTSGLHGELAVTGHDMAFKAALGPLSLSVIGGEASIEGTVDVTFDPSQFTAGRKLVTPATIGDVLTGLDVDFAAPVNVTLPIYFPTESRGVGDLTLTGDLRHVANGLHLQTVPDVLLADGTATGASANTLTDAGAAFLSDGIAAGHIVRITGGTGLGQSRVIKSVADTALTVHADWDVTPDATSIYAVVDTAGAGPLENRNEIDGDDKIVLDVSDVLDDLASGFQNLSLLDQILFIVDGVDVVLGGVQDAMDGEILGVGLPLIGDKLAGAADVVGDFRTGFLNDFRNEIEKLADPSENGVKDILFRLLGNSGLLIAVDGAGNAIKDGGGKFVAGTIDDIVSFNNLATVNSINDAEIWWKVKIGQNLVDTGADIGLDIGIPGLGLETEGDIDLNIDWELDFGFGLSGKDGFFFFIDDEDELVLTARVDADASLKGTLGFLEFTAANEDVDGDDLDGNTHLAASFAIDIGNGSDPSDQRLGLSELGSMSFDVLFEAEAAVELAMTLGIAGDQGNFPQIKADFFLDWGTGPIDLFDPADDFDLGTSIQDGLRVVEFRDVAIDAGSYINNVIGPLLDKIQDVTEPVQPIIDIVTTPLPVLSHLGLNITLLDIAKMTGHVNPAFITALETILDVVTVVNSVDIPEGGSLLIPLGDFTIYERSTAFDALLAANGLADFEFNLGSGDFDLTTFRDAATRVGGLLEDQLGGPLGSIVGEITGVAGDILAELAQEAGGEGGSPFSFPLLENPSQVFGLLMGKEATLVQYDMPPLDFAGEFTAFFSIFGPLGVSINLEAALTLDLLFGYDTKGLRDFAATDFRNPVLLANGLFVGDDLTPGDGDDPAELTFDGGLWAAAELNLGIARGGVGGGIFIGVDFNLFDNDGDGKVRLDELFTNFSNQLKAPSDAAKVLAPLAIFDVSGKITAELFAFLKIKLGFVSKSWTFNITPPLVLADFDIDFHRPPVLATELDNGDLILNIGDFAEQRQLGDLTDFGEHIFVESAGAGKVNVWSDNLGADAAAKQTYSVTGRIIAVGGKGDDVIDLSGVTTPITFELEGGVGNDTVKGGAGGGIIRGGLGNDDLYGGDAADLIFGNEGADTAHGGAGADILLGDNGEVSDGLIMADRHGFVRALVTSSDGVDELYGEGGDDIVAGSGAADKVLDGGADNDIVVGDGALFTYHSPVVVSETDKGTQAYGDLLIKGGSGNDWLYGGKGNDTVEGNEGNDVVFGESGTDNIKGGDGDDTLFGDSGKFLAGDLAKPVVTVGGEGDSIFGGAGNDKMLGGGGNDLMRGDGDNDLMWGGTGIDTLYGDDGDDIIYGESDPDKLYGNAGKDHLEGGQGNDSAWGGADQDTLAAGYGSDTLDGEDGSDLYRITARGGLVTELTTAYDTGDLLEPEGDDDDIDNLVLIGTSESDTVLLRGMADFYFPTLKKLIGNNSSPQSSGLIDRIFASGEPDKLRAILQALEDAYGPHSIPAGSASLYNAEGGLLREIIDLYTAEVRDDLFAAIDATYGTGPEGGVPAKQALKDLIFKAAEGAEPATGILATDSGRIPGKLEEIKAAIIKAYGSKPVPPTMLDAIAAAWDALTPALQTGIEAAIQSAYKTEAQVLGTDTDTGFVALINNGGSNVERFNYRNMEGLTVNTLDGNDYVVLDDVLAATTINLGLGEDKAQVGQVFRSERVKDFAGEPAITGITAEDVFTTLEITRGWLSNGVSEATVINGGDGNDEITVFHNVAVLNLNGGDGDDVFTVRAFALKGSSDSERARTDMKGDGGADTVLYVLNAPVGIDGGDGLDTVRIVGTEFADDFVVTDAGIFGAGLNVSFINIEKVVVDGAEGDDRFFIQSTGLEVVTEIDGGLGSDSFFVGGNPSGAPVSVVSNDLKGHSGVILHSIERGSDPAWAGVPIAGVSANIGDDEEAAILVFETGGSSRVVEGAAFSTGEGWGWDSYGIRLTSAPTATVRVKVVPAGMSPEEEARGFKDLEFVDALGNLVPAPVLEFTAANWNTLQHVRFRATDDAASEGRRSVFINHILETDDAGYESAQMRSVKVLMEDDDRDGVIITPAGRDNRVLENGPSAAGFTDSFDVVLAQAPTADVTVTMTVLNGQVLLGGPSVATVAGQPTLTFTTADWNVKQTVTITAPDDALVEGFHTDYIRYTVASADVDETRPSGGGAPGTAPAYVQVDGDFDLAGVQAIPDAKPTSYVLLAHRPIAGTLDVKVDGVQLASNRFSITGNTLTFLSAGGQAEFRTGLVEAKYSYKEAGYHGSFVKDSVVDIYDEDTPTVIIQEPDDGSVDVIEGSGESETYSIRLSQAPTSDVVIKLDAVDTRTTYGRTALFQEQVTVDSASQTLLTFTSSDWFTPKVVTVRAIDDAVFDGNDTQVFAPDLQTVNKIRGPLIIEGAAGAGSLSLPLPLMLPHEKNVLEPDGVVQTFTKGSGAGAVETMTVLLSDLQAVVAELREEDGTVTSIQDLAGKTLELSSGPGTGLVLDPARPDDLFDRFWQILSLSETGDGKVTLTLLNPSTVDPSDPNVTAPGNAAETVVTKYAITSLSANFFAKESEQIDYLFVFDDDSVANDSGALTSADGVVRGFDDATQTMLVDTAALQAVAKLSGSLDPASLIGRRLEISVGPGQGRSWTIQAIADGAAAGIKKLTLSDAQGGSEALATSSEFRIQGGDTKGRIIGFGMGPSTLVDGQPQPGGISYGDLEVVQVSLGRGNDTVRVDYATNAEDHTTRIGSGDYATQTLLDTGAGDDAVTVNLDAVEDGAFALNLNDGNDTADGSASTLALTVFGWDGQDKIAGGAGADILFGDRGRVDYVKTVLTDTDIDPATPDVPVDQIVTRLGHSVPQNPVNPKVTAATATTLTDTTANLATAYGGLAGLSVQAISSDGHVQYRTIIANTHDTITVDRPWDSIPGPSYSYRVSALPEDQTDGLFRGARLVWSIDDAIGGADIISGQSGDDLIIGGADADIIKGDANHDWIAGDSARFDFEPVTGTDGPTRITLIQTTISIGGGDTLSGDAGADVILGGAAGDTIYGDDATGSAGAADGDDIVIGDNGQLRFLNGALARFATTDDGEATGGVDTIHGNAGADFILGGAAGDTIYGDAAQAGLHDGADVVIGDNGEVSYVGGYGGADALQATIDLIRATDPVGFGGSDTIFGNDEDDILIGGAAGDNISGDADRDLILGDQGTVRLFNGVITDAALRDIPPDTAGDDFLTGGAHADLVLGGLGADKISGLGDADVLIGDEAEVLYDPDGVTLRSIKTLNRSNGDADVIFGGDQDDILIGGAKSDRLDGGSQHDLIFGDNVELTLKASSGDAIDPRFRALVGATIYGDDGLVRVAGEFEEAIQPVPGGRPTWADWRITLDPSLDAGQFGDDYIAGGAHDDEIFGQLGNDTIQGDGTIGPETGEIPANFVVPSMDFALAAGGTLTLAAPTNAGAKRGSDGSLTVTPSFEGQSDGDDYIEGNAGDDVIFGNLGQDDIIGGSSNLFSLVVRDLRQDGTDLLFGGAGTDISRNHLGDAAEPTGHSRDADMILGDNGDIFRLVGAGGANIGNYVTFTYDTYNGGTGSTNKIIPRAAELLDYTPGGPDFSTAASADAGAADEIHGESGDDFIYGMTGSDALFGEGQDDDLIGGWGHDWISGGTGDDGVIGDDGRILTSRNGSTEPLAGVTAAAVQSTISTPGNVQVATINVAGQLVKAVDLTPFVKSATDPLFDPEFADDLVYGGWGNDFLHAGWGDDGVSGAEALAGSYDRPVNPGNVLGYDKATGEFIWYDEYNPMTRIAGFPLNFAADEGSIVENNIFSDGDDRIFGDHGNDWLVGGTGRDNMYGGWGDDLLNADDDQATGGGLNLSPDTHASYEDRAFGGAGRDVLIGNTGGDRLIDWVGEFNSYVVPFAPFGLGTVSRALQPQLPEFLYALSKSDGADQTLGSLGDPRNGEPWGELGLVRQQDFAWQDQTGAPADPQAGNVPGGKRDVLRSADFNNGQLQAFAPDSGTWQVSGGALQVASTSMTSDAVAVYQVGDALPSYYEVLATLKVIKPTAGWGANSYVVFDYQSKTDFKFAGIDVATNKLVIGHRTAAGWNVLAQAVFTGSLKSDAWYHAMLSVNGLTATLSVNNASAVSYVFQPTVVDGYKHGLNWGLVGFGSNQSRGAIDNIAVQTVPPTATVTYREDFTAGAGPMFDTQSTGRWSVSDGRLTAAPLASGDTALALIDLSNTTNLRTASLLELSSTFRTAGRAGFVFDFYSNTDFKFAAIDVLTKQVVIGHRTTAGWTVDAVASQSTLNATTDYTLGLTVRGSAVSVTLNGQAVTGFTYNAVSVDGRFGLLTGGTGASFDSVTAKTNDAAVPASQTSTSAATAAPLTGSVSQEQVQVLAAEAVQRWSSVEDTSHLTRLAQLEFVVADLPGDRLAEYADGRLTIDWDAAGQGWFVDPTPGDDAEFVGSGSTLVATPTGGAAGLIDLLSVIAHEMGHAIGLGHSDSGVMDETRAPGERALPDAWFTGVQVASRGLGVEEEHTGAGGAENPVHDVHGDLPGQPDEAGRLAGNAAIFAALAAGLPVSSVVAADVPLAEVTLRSSAPLRSLLAETQITVSAKRAAAESGAAASRAGSGAALTDLGDTDVGDLPGQSLDETRKRPGGAPALDALAPGLAVASRVAADAPIHETVPGSGAPPQSAPPMSSTAGGSFVDLTAPASRAASQSAATAAIEATGHQHRSSRAPASKPSAPTINWGSSQTGALDHLDVGSPHGTSAWLDDFLNHLGTTQAQRNPNAGLRVRPGATKAMA